MLLIIINVKKTKESEVSVLFRIMTNYLQLLTTSMSFSTSYPGALSDIFYPAQRVGGSSDTFLSFDCFVDDYQIKGPFESTALFKQFLLFFLAIDSLHHCRSVLASGVSTEKEVSKRPQA